jgi:DHA1 family bicyclomycin/chloramphenicol resistance-like MFS transporter
MLKEEKLDFVIIIMCITSLLSSLSVDSYWPAIKLIREDFKCSDSSMQFGMGINFMFPALIGFIYGYLADSFGKRRIMLLAILVLLVGNIGCFLANKIFIFNIFRAILGAGTGAVSIIPATIFIEQYSKNYATRLISLNASFQALGLVISPIIGAFIITSHSWRTIFLFLVCITLITLLMLYFILPKTLDNTKKVKKDLRCIFINYTTIVRNRSFICNNLILALPMSAFFIVSVSLPFMYIEKLGITPTKYAYFKTFGPITCFIFAFYVRRFIKKHDIELTIKWAIITVIIGSILLIFSTLDNNPYFITLSLTIYSLLFPFLYPPIISRVLGIYKDDKCFISSVCFNIRNLCVWIGITISSFIYNDSLFPAAIISLLAILIAFMLNKKSIV